MNVFKNPRSLFCAASLALSALLSACGGGDNGRDPILGVSADAVVSVEVTPATAAVVVDGTQQYAATATYADGTKRNVTTLSAWTSSSTAVATVGAATGLATGRTVGASLISAAFGGQTGSANLTVNPIPTLTGLSLTPGETTIVIGATQQYAVTATYSDGTSAAITAPLTWLPSNAAVATVSATGLATGNAAGATLITATSGSVSGSAVLNVTPVPVIPPVPPVVPPVPPIVPGTIDLGLASNFAVLAGSSLTNNSLATVIGGDVGSPTQSVPPTLRAGYVNHIAGLAPALNSLTLAINDAESRTCTVTFAGNIDLGGLTLPPGVYCYAGAINITGTLILSGPGVYIFRTAMTLDAVANSTVATFLADSAQVYWVPVGATTIGANSNFKGSILSRSAAITVGDMTVMNKGRVLSNAAVTLRSNTIDK